MCCWYDHVLKSSPAQPNHPSFNDLTSTQIKANTLPTLRSADTTTTTWLPAARGALPPAACLPACQPVSQSTGEGQRHRPQPSRTTLSMTRALRGGQLALIVDERNIALNPHVGRRSKSCEPRLTAYRRGSITLGACVLRASQWLIAMQLKSSSSMKNLSRGEEKDG